MILSLPPCGEGWEGRWRGNSVTLAYDLPTPTPSPSPQGGGENAEYVALVLVNLDEMRAKTATMKPKAAGSAASLWGTTSCKALQAKPPSGREPSSAARPKGRA